MNNTSPTVAKPAASPDAQDDAQDDAQLLARAATGDALAFEVIMRRHNRVMFRTARSILKNDAETEDAVQEAYWRAWRNLANFRADSRLSTWLVRIVINEALGRLRLRSRDAQVIALEPASAAANTALEAVADEAPGSDPEQGAMRAQLRALIEARIDALPDVFRTVFVLRAVEEMSVEDAAQALGIPEATVRSRFFRARGVLREGLARDIDLGIEDAFSFDGARCDSIVHRVLARIASGRTP